MARVVLMEDDVPLGLELAAGLRAGGHEVTLVHSGTEARQVLWDWDFDLLITDMIVRQGGRPVPDGGLSLIGWARQMMRADPKRKTLPIIAISGATSRQGLEFLMPTAVQVGADIVLEKPVDMEKLLRAIGDQLAAMPKGEAAPRPAR